MARMEPDSAMHLFFICIGDHPDGQGFAAFGCVVKGMDIVHKIHAPLAGDQMLKPPVCIQRAIRVH